MGSKPSALRPTVEPVEARQLPSGLMVALQPRVSRPGGAAVVDLASAQARSTASVASAANAGAVGAVAGSPDQSALALTTPAGVYSGSGTANTGNGSPAGPNAAVNLPISPLLGTGTPTKAELAREKFTARFSGPMTTLAPRFSDQSKIIYMHGLGTAPRFFLHGDYALAIAFPAGFDPKNPAGTFDAQDNPAGTQPVTGFAFLDDKNNNSGATVGLDLSADPTSFDKQGRPTRLNFTSDPNIYSGVFYVSQSSGTVTIKYGRNTATATFDGRLYTTGLTSPFQNITQYSHHSG